MIMSRAIIRPLINLTKARPVVSTVLRSSHTAYSRLNLQDRVPFTITKRTYAESSAGGYAIPKEVSELPQELYHQEADRFLEDLMERLEDISAKFPSKIPDVDLSHGVLTLDVPSVGTYVINKQPPNKQIWYASPISGPNRYDLYKNTWVSLRDESKLLEILTKELQSVLDDKEISLMD